jgi:hypothetical protein
MVVFQGDWPRAAWLQTDRTARTLLCALPMIFMVLRVESLTAGSSTRKRAIALASPFSRAPPAIPRCVPAFASGWAT